MSIKIWFKQLLCRHMFKTLKQDYLRSQREVFSDGLYGYLTAYENYSYYAQHQVCIKCSKERIVEKRLLDI